ncbi:MAG TPA: N-acetylmuramoyl-L-alanine amidase [Candidatus Obscuribacterales bacterium]
MARRAGAHGQSAVAIVCVGLLSILSGGGSTPAQNQEPPGARHGSSSPTIDISPREPIGVSRNGIFVSYPHDGTTIDATSTYIGGAVSAGSTLELNGQPVRVNKQGFFAQVVPLAQGNNQFNLVKNGTPDQVFTLNIHRPAPPPPVPEQPAQILKSSLKPDQDIGVQPGDLIEFGMRASPGGQASVKIGTVVVPLQPPGTSSPNRGLDTAFGVTYQKTAATIKDLYTGFYRVSAADSWHNETPQFFLLKDGVTLHENGDGRITVLDQPFLSSTVHDQTIVRVGPGAGRTTPMPAGVRVLVDGYVGDQYRCLMSADKHLWIDKSELSGNEGAGSPPSARVSTINIENEGVNGARVVVPLNQRLPFELKQEITSGNRLQMRIYGAVADTDWITEPSTSSKAVPEAVATASGLPLEEQTLPIVRRKSGLKAAGASAVGSLPAVTKGPYLGRAFPADRARNPVTFITWQQIADRVYLATINLNVKKQWGFWGDYEGTNLVLHIKGAPKVVPGSLRGLKICVDPGHGGSETGAIGLSGIKEATLNFAVAKRLEGILKQRGATVIMTRDGDVKVSLEDRVKVASDNNCDLLLSVHHNSLPDARNPLTEHGTSSYYYHPQALAFATLVRQGVVNKAGFVDFHTRWQNLALCRPSRQVSGLAEVAFMINPDEYAAELTDAGQERAAEGLAQGVENFVFDKTPPHPAVAKSHKAPAPKNKHR